MANTVIQLKFSTETGNVPTSLANGEISINNRDGKFFYSTPANVVVTHYPYPGPSGLNQEVQFNDSGVLGSDSGLIYNKTTDVLTVVGGAIVGGVNVTPQIQFAFTQANAAFIAANSAGVYANGAFAKANTQDTINLTQNNSITAAFAAANAATATDTTQNNSITAAFTAANSAGVYANGAFARANNSLNANTGGTITGDLTIGTGTGGVIAGANVIYSNVFVANSGGYVQFADGSRQFTANAGSGGGGTSNSFATISNTATALVANTSNTRLTIVGESGIVVAMNSSINQITIAAQPGAQGLTVDYGFVAEPVFYALDYGTL
jgi:hypothetical protein